MFKTKLPVQAALNAFGAFVYIALIAWFMSHAERFFGGVKEPDFRIPLLMLTLFVFSALVTSLLILGRPIYLFMSGNKKDAAMLLSYTVVSFFVLLMVAFVLLASAGR